MAVSNKAGIGLVAMALAALAAAAPADAQGKDQLSDNSVKWLMGGAWAITPPTYTNDGKTITIDKTKRAEVMVPIEVGRSIIQVAWRSAMAQICDLDPELAANYGTMIARERAKNKWSDQQIVYISQLHLFTVSIRTGKAQIVAKEGDQEVVINEKPTKVETCGDAERAKVREQIKAYVESEAAPAAATSGAAAPATPAATAASAPPPKK